MTAMNMHKQVEAVKLNKRYGAKMPNTKIALRLGSSPTTIGYWVDQYRADRFGLTKDDIRFLAEDVGLLPKEEE